jgi:hypothetical protein
MACAMMKTGAANGTCAPILIGTDPDSECSGGGNGNCCSGAVCGPC